MKRVSGLLPVELYFRSTRDIDECTNTELKQVTKSSETQDKPELVEISKECSKIFKSDETQYKIGLKYSVDVFQDL